MPTPPTHALAFTLTPSSSASLYNLAADLAERYGSPLPYKHILVLHDAPLTSLKTLQGLVDSLGDRSPAPAMAKVELKIVDVLVETDKISIGLEVDHKQRQSGQNLVAELHMALFPTIRAPPLSSQIFRMELFTLGTFDEQHKVTTQLQYDSRRLDTLDVWLQLRKEGQIKNGGSSGGGLQVAGVINVETESLVLLEQADTSAECWELGRVRLG